MARHFNTTGPCRPEMHYMLPPEARLPELLPLVEQEQYFVIHAARQTGKTTAARAFAERLRGLGYVAVWATLETSQGIEDIERAEPLWLQAIEEGGRVLPEAQRPPARQGWATQAVGGRLSDYLRSWCARLPVPLVLLLDEADVLSGDALISFLRQLRAGFMDRGVGRFPVSVALVGMRDLRDYLTRAKDGVPVNPGSPFNIKSESITLRAFTRDEVATLYAQHTGETGQPFTEEAVDRAIYWSAGQPFLVNALAREAVGKLVSAPNLVTAGHIDQAKERLLRSRTTHLDALGQRLKDARVAPILRAMLLGDERINYESDDFDYCVDLGLVRRSPDGAEVANPLYREVLARQLSYNEQENLPSPWWKWQAADGSIDMPALMEAFFEWWRENAEIAMEHNPVDYREAVPHLCMMAFLQRVVNGGGRIQREFAAGRGAVDLVVEYGGKRTVIELKRVAPTHSSLETVRRKGLVQLQSYLDRLGETEGWLLIFDQRAGLSWEQRLWTETVQVEGKTIWLRGG